MCPNKLKASENDLRNILSIQYGLKNPKKQQALKTTSKLSKEDQIRVDLGLTESVPVFVTQEGRIYIREEAEQMKDKIEVEKQLRIGLNIPPSTPIHVAPGGFVTTHKEVEEMIAKDKRDMEEKTSEKDMKILLQTRRSPRSLIKKQRSWR